MILVFGWHKLFESHVFKVFLNKRNWTGAANPSWRISAKIFSHHYFSQTTATPCTSFTYYRNILSKSEFSLNAIPSLHSPFRLTSLIYGGQAMWTRNWTFSLSFKCSLLNFAHLKKEFRTVLNLSTYKILLLWLIFM